MRAAFAARISPNFLYLPFWQASRLFRSTVPPVIPVSVHASHPSKRTHQSFQRAYPPAIPANVHANHSGKCLHLPFRQMSSPVITANVSTSHSSERPRQSFRQTPSPAVFIGIRGRNLPLLYLSRPQESFSLCGPDKPCQRYRTVCRLHFRLTDGGFLLSTAHPSQGISFRKQKGAAPEGAAPKL